MLSFNHFDTLLSYELERWLDNFELESSRYFYLDSLTDTWRQHSYTSEKQDTASESIIIASTLSNTDSFNSFPTSRAESFTPQSLNLTSFYSTILGGEIIYFQTLSSSSQSDWIFVNTAGDAATEFNIELIFTDDNLTDSQQALFLEAADRWEQIVVEDVPDTFVRGIGWVDDIVIEVSVPSIDGVGGILGQAGPTAIRNDSSLPAAGIIEIDSADVAQLEAMGQLDDVIIHEMAHVLGFGTIWRDLGLIEGVFGPNPRYVGEQAVEEYNDIFGVNETYIPIEDDGGFGTRNSHWEESVFDNELMTGFLNGGEDNPISSITVAAMADLGYEVNLGAADPYSPTDSITQSSAAIAVESSTMETESIWA